MRDGVHLITNALECDNDCGAKIEVTGHHHADTADGLLHSIAELLGWTTRGKLVYCKRCYLQAKIIVGDTDPPKRKK
jgi:hypothetical protein